MGGDSVTPSKEKGEKNPKCRKLILDLKRRPKVSTPTPLSKIDLWRRVWQIFCTFVATFQRRIYR